MEYVGVDGCRAGWIAVSLVGDAIEWAVHATFGETLDAYGGAALVFVDMPIGLSGPGVERLADAEARKALPAHLKSAVFNVPTRQAVYAPSKKEAKRINRELTGKSLSEQSLGIMQKIREVDSELQQRPEVWGRVYESHPELCFGAVAGRFPAHPKKDFLGGLERLRIVATHAPDAETILRAVRGGHPRSMVAADDVLDAMILAVAARASGGRPKFHPSGAAEPPLDETGLPMAIWHPEPKRADGRRL